MSALTVKSKTPLWVKVCLIASFTLIAALTFFGCFMSARQSTAFWNDCQGAGGRVMDLHGSSSRICVSDDGRIIEIPLR